MGRAPYIFPGIVEHEFLEMHELPSSDREAQASRKRVRAISLRGSGSCAAARRAAPARPRPQPEAPLFGAREPLRDFSKEGVIAE